MVSGIWTKQEPGKSLELCDMESQHRISRYRNEVNDINSGRSESMKGQKFVLLNKVLLKNTQL